MNVKYSVSVLSFLLVYFLESQHPFYYILGRSKPHDLGDVSVKVDKAVK